MYHWSIYYVTVTNYPTDITGSPIHLPRLNTVDILHTVFKCNSMSAIFTDNSFWLSGRSRSIENIEWVIRSNGCRRNSKPSLTKFCQITSLLVIVHRSGMPRFRTTTDRVCDCSYRYPHPPLVYSEWSFGFQYLHLQ